VEKALKILNDLETKGLIKRYAIGGGIAVLYYAEPVLTYDLDVFCLIPPETGELITLSPIYEHLQEKGYRMDGEHVLIEGIPVQFIPAYNKLVEEAINEAVKVDYKRVKTKIVRAEHLLAIMLQTYRPKDRERMLLFVDEARLDMVYLEDILVRHGLQKKWRQFRRRYDEA
jgi:hypothetical protein